MWYAQSSEMPIERLLLKMQPLSTPKIALSPKTLSYGYILITLQVVMILNFMITF
jgi:hypothetical protein